MTGTIEFEIHEMTEEQKAQKIRCQCTAHYSFPKEEAPLATLWAHAGPAGCDILARICEGCAVRLAGQAVIL